MQNLFLKLKIWWETADRTQKTVTIFGSLFLVLLVAGVMFFAGKPKMDVLFRDLSPQDQGMVAGELTKMGVPFEQDRGGGIKVPSDRIAEVQGKLAVAQKMPTTGHSGYDGLDKMGIMNTPVVERERLKTMLEGELAKSIEAIEGVAAARVHLTVQDSSPFVRESSGATASVVVTESAAGAVNGQTARAIQKLVQFGVQGLKPKDISVISSEGKTLLDGAEGGLGASDRLGQEIAESRRREVQLQNLLDSAFGRGNTVVSVPILELNFDQRDESKNEVIPTKPLVIEKNTETMGAGSTAAGGPAGTASNLPAGTAAPATPASGDSKSYTGTQEAKQMAASEVRTTTVFAPGSLKKMAINVLVNNTVITSAAEVQKVIDGALGPLAQDRQNFATTVTSVPFDTKAQEAQKKADEAAAGSAKMQQMLSILPIAALLFVGFMVIKALKKATSPNVVITADQNGEIGAITAPQPSEPLILEVQTGGQVKMPNGQMVVPTVTNEKGEKVALPPGAKVSADGKVVGPDGQPIPQYNANDFVKTNAAALALTEMVDSEQQHIKIGSIPDRVNIPLEQIKKMAEERPQTVAMLLKSWLLHEK